MLISKSNTKFKLNILVIGIMTVIVTGVGIAGFSVLLLQRSSSISREPDFRGTGDPVSAQIEYVEGRKDSYFQVVRTLASVMEDYEDIPAAERRDFFDTLLYSTVTHKETIITMYTVWKPGTIDGMDASFITRPGSCPETGQYASAFTRETGEGIQHLTANLKSAMTFLTGPNSREEKVDPLIPDTPAENDVFLFNIMVPIICPGTNEVVGGVGAALAIAPTLYPIYKEGSMLTGANDMTQFNIILLLVSMFMSGIIILSVLMFVTRPMLVVTEKLKNITEKNGLWPDELP